MASGLFFTRLLPVALLVLSFQTAAEFRSEKQVRVGSDPVDKCVYTVYIRTGTVWKGGTDSIISLSLGDVSGGRAVSIANLETWGGQMEPGHDYFERGNLDIFSGRGLCLDTTPCYLELVSDGTGSGHGWYCNYVEVTVTGPHLGCGQQLFTVEEWLATDRSPYNLTAVRDNCKDGAGAAGAAGAVGGVRWRAEKL